MVLLYFIVAFIVCFFMYKIREDKIKKSVGPYNVWFESEEYWFLITVTLLWIVALPCIGLWLLLDKLTYSLFNKK